MGHEFILLVERCAAAHPMRKMILVLDPKGPSASRGASAERSAGGGGHINFVKLGRGFQWLALMGK